ncbi:MAG TPA: hypothetical protein VJ846_11205, partial [Sphingomicrobium sp.]|nr:hypothetical protein [Sphingomicrobium sp.]
MLGNIVARTLPDADFDLLPFGGNCWRVVAEGETLGLKHIPALFAIGDGFVGLRGPGETEGQPRVFLNGVFEKMPIAYHESAHGFARESDVRLAVADATRPVVAIDGKPLGDPHLVELDMGRGMLVQHFLLENCEVRVKQ